MLEEVSQGVQDAFFVALEDRLCVVCMEASRGVVFRPCDHFVVCALCAERLRCCPMCMVDVERAVSVFH